MSKYIDAEKMIAFLENKKAENIIGGDYSDGVLDTCDNILAFITSLQQEQPEVDLEKEIEVCWETYIKDAFGIPIEGRITKYEVEEIARHFYELGRLNTKKEESK